ncbi:MAG TPA: entericidin A/B family lipoprotein [Ramlibacter sp.]|nr:entericidin A/B family lipoprotein [Ramlibacter sp.]
MKRLLAVVLAAVVLAGCNTIAGFGKDVETAGGALDRAATNAKKK